MFPNEPTETLLKPDLDNGEFNHCVRPCPDCKLGGPKVGSRGKWDAPIVIVGEGPGIQEIKSNKPFLGPAGELLAKCWPTEFDIPLEDTFILNAMQCFIPKASKDPTRLIGAVHACYPRLNNLIGLAPRKVILAFGKWSNASLTGNMDFKILANRGNAITIQHPGRPGEECILMHILHPSYILRGQGNLDHFRNDLRRAVAYAYEGSGIYSDKYTDPIAVPLTTAEDIRQLIDHLRGLQNEYKTEIKVAADIETTGFRFQKDRILCIGLYPNTGNPEDNEGWILDWDYILKEWKEVLGTLEGMPGAACIKGKYIPLEYRNTPYYTAAKELLEMTGIKWGWQNGKFDVKFLREDGINARIDVDSFLMSYALNERPGNHGLEELAKNYLGAPNYKDELKKWAPKKTDSYILVPKPTLWLYLARDVKNTALVIDALEEKVAEDKATSKECKYTLLPAAEMLSRVESRGIAVDLAFVEENKKTLEEEQEVALAEIAALAGWNVNPNSPPQVKELLYEQLGLRLKGRKPTDTTKEVLDKLYETTQHPVLKAIRKYRKVTKALGTYVLAVPKHLGTDNRIHTTYNLGGSRTGRLASSDPNIQNIPREARLRRMYCAAPGKVFVEGDYNTAELRGLAAFSGDRFLTEVFLDGNRSLHDEVSIKMYGPNFTGDQRIRAKAINFGIPYGRQAFSIAEEFDISVKEAQKLIDDWFDIAPEAAAFLHKCRQAPLKGQTLVSIFGRKCRPGFIPMEKMDEAQNEFANFFMQSTINDFTLHSAIVLEGVKTPYQAYAKMFERCLRDISSEAGIVNLVHDSLLVETPIGTEKEVAKVMQHVMETVPTFWIDTPIRFKVDFKVGTHWGLLEKMKGL